MAILGAGPIGLEAALYAAMLKLLFTIYEIVMENVDLASVDEAPRVGVRAACIDGVLGITTGNYGGKLGPFHLHLHKLLGPG